MRRRAQLSRPSSRAAAAKRLVWGSGTTAVCSTHVAFAVSERRKQRKSSRVLTATPSIDLSSMRMWPGDLGDELATESKLVPACE